MKHQVPSSPKSKSFPASSNVISFGSIISPQSGNKSSSSALLLLTKPYEAFSIFSDSSKRAAEIRNPIECRRVWLGTYNTAKEAFIAYEIKKLEFEKMKKASYGFIKSNNALDEDLLPDRGLIMDPNEMTLEDAGKDLDLGTMELGASFLDCFDDALNGFENVVEFNLCGFDEKMTSDLPDWDFGEFDDEERAWFDALELDEQ
nr:ethylene-responsive transcription factor ERF118-like [Tanacetum cinerariifolium]